MGVATVPDYGITPAVQAAFPDASKRQLVANVVAQVNADIRSTAQADHIVVADLSGLVGATFGPEGSFNTNVLIGNVQIHLNQTTSSNPSQAGFVSDGVHPNTTLQGVLANLFIQALDTGYNAGIPLFTEAQILSHDGLAYGGSDTLNAAIGPYTNFVTSYAPTPPGAGDANNDHVVNGLDISLVSSNWLKVGSNNPGDVNGDGVVNGLDIATISSNWLNTYGGGATAVPEPSTSLLAILGLAIAIAARAGRSRNDQADGLNRTSTQ